MHFLSKNPKQGRLLSAMGSGTANQSLSFTRGNSNVYKLICLGRDSHNFQCWSGAAVQKTNKIFGEGKSKSVCKKENKLHGKRQITLWEQSLDFVLCSPFLPVTWEKRPEPASTIPVPLSFLFSKFPKFFTAVMHAGKRSRKGSSEPGTACHTLLKGNNLLDSEGTWIWVSSVFPWALLPLFYFCKAKKNPLK